MLHVRRFTGVDLLISISERGQVQAPFSPHFSKPQVRKCDMKRGSNIKHRPELGACPCMRVGGFKRNPTGFSSGEVEHKREQDINKKDPRVTQRLIKGMLLLSLHLSDHSGSYHSNPCRASTVVLRSSSCAIR